MDSDMNQQIQQRLQYGHGHLDEHILEDLLTMMHKKNPYYSIFKVAKERISENVNLCLNLTTFDAKKQDPRRYNLPTASEVGVIISKDISEINAARDLIIEHRTGELQRISELHSGYLPLRFPLLFPYGEPGWHPTIPFSETHSSEENHQQDKDLDKDDEEYNESRGTFLLRILFDCQTH
jgi:hypothetical protein